MGNIESPRLEYAFKLLATLVLLVISMQWARDVVIPLTFSAFFSLALLPATTWLEKKRIGRVVAILITLLITTIILIAVGYFSATQINDLVTELPDLRERFNNYITKVSEAVENRFGLPLEEQTEYIKKGAENASGMAADFLLGTGNVLGALIQIPIYMFLMLFYQEKFRIFINELIPQKNEAGENFSTQLRRVVQDYFVGLLTVLLIISALNSIGLLIIGLPHAIFLGCFAGLLTIIPYVGNFVGGLLPVVIALVTKDSAWYAVAVIGVFVIVQFLEGNFITPRVVGSKVTVNALAAIVALLLGAQMMGIAGMILAIPMLGIIKLVLMTSRNLRPFTRIIGD